MFLYSKIVSEVAFLNDGVNNVFFYRIQWSLVAISAVISSLYFFRGRPQGEEGEQMVDNMVWEQLGL